MLLRTKCSYLPPVSNFSRLCSALKLDKTKQTHALIIDKAPTPAKAVSQLCKGINIINYSIFSSLAQNSNKDMFFQNKVDYQKKTK